jgi:molybdopterin-guanine dinucleotide biosynthesis protein A
MTENNMDQINLGITEEEMYQIYWGLIGRSRDLHDDIEYAAEWNKEKIRAMLNMVNRLIVKIEEIDPSLLADEL